jgi:Ricin-type beta-trefoil lectin domain
MRRLPLAALAVTGLVAGIIGMAVPTLASTPAPAPAATQAPTPVRTAAAPSAITEHYTGTLVFVNFSVDRCIGIAGGKAGIYTCTFVNDQAWQVIATKTVSGNTYAQIENHKGQCMGVSKSRVVGQACNSANNGQYWNNTVKGVVCGAAAPVVNLASGKVVGVAGASTANGAAVVIFAYQHKCNNQFWTLKATLT